MIASRPLALAALVTLAAGQFAPAALVTRDSLDFENNANNGNTGSYEADSNPNHANTVPQWNGANGNVSTYGAAGSRLSLTTTYGTNRYFHNEAFWSPDVSRSTGYTVEFAMRVESVDDAVRGPALFRIADGVQMVELEWRSDAVVWNNSATTSVTLNPAIDHVYRVTYDPTANNGTGAYAAWIDGTLISDTLSGVNSTASYLLFGDTSDTRYGGTTSWDYIRWDTTGAFAPIPEPASLALLALGGVMFLRRR